MNCYGYTLMETDGMHLAVNLNICDYQCLSVAKQGE